MKKKKYYIALDDFERRVVINCMNEMRNTLIAGEDEPEREPFGVWGQRHLEYIQKHSKAFYFKLLCEDKLYDYLLQLNCDAEEMFNLLMRQMAEREGVTEQLKEDNQLAWVARMNNIRQRATEVVNSELVFA